MALRRPTGPAYGGKRLAKCEEGAKPEWTRLPKKNKLYVATYNRTLTKLEQKAKNIKWVRSLETARWGGKTEDLIEFELK